MLSNRASRTGPQGGAFLAVLRAALPGLAPSQQLLARTALADPIGTARLTITDYAAITATSTATITRFCRIMGLESYAQFRLELATAAQQQNGRHEERLTGDVSADDSLDQVVGKLGEADAQSIGETAQLLDIEALDAVITAISAASAVHTFGVGAAGVIAAHLQWKLRSLGAPAVSFRDPPSALIGVGHSRPSDVIIVVSQTGAIGDSAQIFAEARRRRCVTVAITANSRSAIAAVADHLLVTVNSESVFRTGALRSRLTELFIADCICTGLVLRRYDESRAALARIEGDC